MNDNNEDIDPVVDPIVCFRRPKNQTQPRMRHLALLAEDLRLVREGADTIDHIQNDISMRMLLITFLMYINDDEEDDSISEFSSSNSSIFMTNSDSDDSESMNDNEYEKIPPLINRVPDNDSDSDFSDFSSNESDTREEMLVAFALLTNLSLDTVQRMMNELLMFSSLRQSDIDSCLVPNVPKMKRSFDSLTDHECYDWTRFTKDQLIELKIHFFDDYEDEMIYTDTENKGKHEVYSKEEIMLIALTYQALGENTHLSVRSLGGIGNLIPSPPIFY